MKKILIIDDDTFFAKALSNALDPRLYEVATATDGKKGLDEVQKSMPDAILLDIRMPNMDGLEFLKQVNQKYGAGKVPVLIVSNLSSIEKISEGIELGVRGYIMKTDESIESIVSKLESLFSEKQR